ncbi:hypothetical protein NP493_404g02076 [Ridgeia piscesae]|uniref:Follistatin n=1 Tax=Ridgeia piscesae TaxID=27915 RepID=A0AAD9NUL6_RIDPI|nr:hypothetical protein NP493_404g02076 [Ridgeia piscesae]
MDGESCILRLVGVCHRAKNMLMQQPQTDSRMSVRPHFGIWVLFTKCTIALLIMFSPAASSSQVGSCWLQVARNGRCRGLLEMGITKEACCATRSGIFTGWTPHPNITSSKLFYWDVIAGGAPDCEPCKTTCENVDCEYGKECRIRNNMPKCVCPSCRKEEHIEGNVCGIDVKTYHSKCSLVRHNCRRKQNIQVDYKGRCRTSCDQVNCDEGKRCVLDQNGLPHCIHCSDSCRTPHGTRRMLCGADGVTYPSSCHLFKATCERGRSVMLGYKGACIVGATCSTITCQSLEKCLTHPVTARPQCVTCDMPCSGTVYGNRVICGSDGQTYSNWCVLREAACQSGVVIETLHSGPCGHESGDEDTVSSESLPEETSDERMPSLPNHSQVVMAVMWARRH